MSMQRANPHICSACNLLLQTATNANVPDIVHGNLRPAALPHHNEHTNSRFLHKSSYSAFVQSATQSCHFCAIFYARLSGVQREELDRYHRTAQPYPGEFFISRSYNQNVSNFRLILRYPAPRGYTGGTAWALMLVNLKTWLDVLPDDPIITTCQLQFSEIKYNEEEMWRTASTWIKQCTSQHVCASKIRPERTSRPSRLVYVGQLADYSDVRLCSKEKIGQECPYVTLSHCWGAKGLDFKLLRGREEQFTRRIPYLELPRTFQDAITATRRLSREFGVSYIWIDALCILQDFKEDWIREAGIVGDIYLNSFCNLAACVGDDSHAGLFPERQPFATHLCSVRGSAQSCFNGVFTVGNFDDNKTGTLRSTLLSRGWVFQEVMLSPRTLYFAPQQLFWECHEGRFCETSPQEHIDQDWIKDKTYLTRSIAFERPLYDFTEKNLCNRVWWDAVYNYSNSQLTDGEDKFVAVHGIVNLLKDAWGQRNKYWAGLWSEELYLHLLWRQGRALPFTSDVDTKYQPVKSHPYFKSVIDRNYERPPYRAPTWSWASVDGRAQNPMFWKSYYGNYSSLIKVADPKIDYHEEHPIQRVKAASLIIRGALLKAELHITDHEHTYSVKSRGREFLPRTTFQLDTIMPLQGEIEVYCLPVAENTSIARIARLFGLLLVRDQGKASIFKRVGMFAVLGDYENACWRGLTKEQERYPVISPEECEASGPNTFVFTLE